MIDFWVPPKPAIIRPAPPSIIRPGQGIKHASILPGIFPAGAIAAAAPYPNIEFIGFTEDTSDNTVHTFTDHAIGAADVTRRVVVAVHSSDLVSAHTYTSITIGGVAATIHPAGTSALSNCTIASLLVSAGTTATIVVTKSGGTPDRCAIAVYRAVNETSATPHATLVDDSISSNVLTGTIDIPTNGWVVAAVQPSGATTPTGYTWVGVTEQYDGPYADAAGVLRSGGFDSSLSAETGRTITATLAAASNTPTGRMVAVSWG